MAVVERTTQTVAATPRTSTHGEVVWRWMTTTDHKVIGNLYFVTSMGFFMFGGVLALAMRAELAFPGLQFLSYETYNQFFTMHGAIMLLLFATPLFAGFANAIMPLQIGAPGCGVPAAEHVLLLAVPVRRPDGLLRVPDPAGCGQLRLVRVRAAERRGQLTRSRQ